jgi:hypothetical protein
MLGFRSLSDKATFSLAALSLFGLVCVLGAALPRSAHTQTQTDALERRLDSLERRMDALEGKFDKPSGAREPAAKMPTEQEAKAQAEKAYHELQLAEESHFVSYEKYTTDYSALKGAWDFTLDSDIIYSEIELVTEPKTGQPGYKFTVRHKRFPNIGYAVDSTSVSIVTPLSD